MKKRTKKDIMNDIQDILDTGVSPIIVANKEGYVMEGGCLELLTVLGLIVSALADDGIPEDVIKLSVDAGFKALKAEKEKGDL